MCLIFFCASTNIFADDSSTIPVLDKAGNSIINLIGAKWVKALLTVALIIEFGIVAFGNAQGEGGIIKKVLPWIIGTAGILGATSIVNYFFLNVTVDALKTTTTSTTANTSMLIETVSSFMA